jgi:hypothetical protein
MRGRVFPWVYLGLTLGKERKALTRLLKTQAGALGTPLSLPRRRLSLGRSIADVGELFDDLAAAHGKDVWVEKTPRHVLHAKRIVRSLPGSVCVHVLREGPDVVASIVDRARRYPDLFPRQLDPKYAVRQWNRSLRATSGALEEPGHLLMFYRKLTEEPETTLRALFQWLGMEFQETTLVPASTDGFTKPAEEWKNVVGGPVAPAKSKFDRLFDEPARRRILNALDKGLFEQLREEASGTPGGILVSDH